MPQGEVLCVFEHSGFLVEGFLHLVSLSSLDFNIVDADGMVLLSPHLVQALYLQHVPLVELLNIEYLLAQDFFKRRFQLLDQAVH